jgi:hypothetical protein
VSVLLHDAFGNSPVSRGNGYQSANERRARKPCGNEQLYAPYGAFVPAPTPTPPAYAGGWQNVAAYAA